MLKSFLIYINILVIAPKLMLNYLKEQITTFAVWNLIFYEITINLY